MLGSSVVRAAVRFATEARCAAVHLAGLPHQARGTVHQAGVGGQHADVTEV
ncbi:MAG: hypothetical protein K0Q46_6643, partial [Rhodococcus erythropolis]|nr:hypothetical protein [Rhodococcus erythropolis]